MDNILLAVVLVISLAATNSSFLKDDQLIDYRVTATKSKTSPFLGVDDCSKTNILVCQDCTSIGLCITNGNGGWNVIDGGTCENGQTCLKGSCTTAPNPTCSSVAKLDFICTATGIFPNPEHCKHYHFCVKDPLDNSLNLFDEECTDNYGYHPKTTFCSKKMKTDECNYYPVPLCKKLGEIARLKDNPSLYYICIKRTVPGTTTEVLYPVIHACEHGRIFDKYLGRCKSN